MSHFHNLTIIYSEPLGNKARAIRFSIADYNHAVDFLPGQYVTLKAEVNGQECRRSYSVSAFSPEEGFIEIGVKRVPDGVVSNYLNSGLSVGDTLQVSDPEGNFVVSQGGNGNHVFFAAGSGITPVISMVDDILKNTSDRVTLFFGNRSVDEAMYLEQVIAMSQHERCTVMEIYSDGSTGTPLTSGRIDFGKATQLLTQFVPDAKDARFYLCGPSGMMSSVNNALLDNGVAENHINMEYFETPDEPNDPVTAGDAEDEEFSGNATVEVELDQEIHQFELDPAGDVIVDAALDQGLDAPFSCKGGVCTTCKARLISGKVKMDSNYALTDDELAEGYILTCQSHPATRNVKLTYDI